MATGAVTAGAAPAYAAASRPAPDLGPVTVGPADRRYQDLVRAGHNGRFTAAPLTVHVLGSSAQVAEVVTDAVRRGRRLAVRSGGHCYEDFVDHPDIQVLIDLSEMRDVSFDPAHNAFAVEPGATLGEVYRRLHFGWGVTLPGGACPGVGAGGHIAGGGYGPLSRRYGMVVDHLYAVEVVVVDRSGRARVVVATRRPDDPHRDLWWAHTGGGGGSFGIVTRYWLRTPGAVGKDPSDCLPASPDRVVQASVTWDWSALDEAAFAAIVRRFGAWHAQHAGPLSPYAALASGLTLGHREGGSLMAAGELDAAESGAEALMQRYTEELSADLGVPHTASRSTTSWFSTVRSVPQGFDRVEFKSKAAFLRRPWTDEQIAAVHRFLTESGGERWGTAVYLSLLGGRTSAVAPDATAMPHRDVLFSAVYETVWGDPTGRDTQLDWIRRFYRNLHAGTGGVPVPNEAYSGAYINYPDTDLADPRWNTSGVPWHTVYFGGNYRRLQQVKARWDARDVFSHALSVRLP
jgi:FAD binding domain/Berberine and berberine like